MADGTSPLERLPIELQEHILSHLSVADLACLAQSCRCHNEIVDNTLVWQAVLHDSTRLLPRGLPAIVIRETEYVESKEAVHDARVQCKARRAALLEAMVRILRSKLRRARRVVAHHRDALTRSEQKMEKQRQERMAQEERARRQEMATVTKRTELALTTGWYPSTVRTIMRDTARSGDVQRSRPTTSTSIERSPVLMTLQTQMRRDEQQCIDLQRQITYLMQYMPVHPQRTSPTAGAGQKEKEKEGTT